MADHPVGDPGEVRPVHEDLEFRVPSVVLVFAPVLIALFTHVLSLASWSVFIGFEENQPGTWLSLTLMFTGLLLAMPAIRNSSLEPERRRAALVLSLVIGGALLDERLQWHEAIGRFISGLVDTGTYPWIVYADDVLIILLSVVGAWVLWKAIEAIPEVRRYVPYVVLIVLVAGLHGVLDLLGHRHYVWRIIWPDITLYGSAPFRDVLGFFEESAKLWTEYFVILLLLHFLHRQKGHLAWTVLVMVGSWMATAGLWHVTQPPFVPYVVLGVVLRFLRNYPLLLTLAVVWLGWSAVVWKWFRHDPDRTALAGLVFLWPWVQGPPWLLVLFVWSLGLAMREGWRPAQRAWRALVIGLIVAFFVGLGLFDGSYLTNRPFSPPESVLFDTGRQLMLPSDR